MLSDSEIVRRLRAIRYSPTHERNARRAPSINALAKQADLTRAALYLITNTGRLGPSSRSRLAHAFTCQA